MARPAAPMTATKEVVSTPIIEATLTISRTLRMMLIRLPMKPCRVRSTRRCVIRALTLPVSRLISHQPSNSVTRARSNWPLYSRAMGPQVSDAVTS
ncbi:hypothetical protein FQZ97_1154130 [compost metagenome]